MNKKSIYQFSENTLSLLSIKAIDLGLTLWLIPYLILKIGIKNYGVYIFVISFILILQNVLNYGFNIATVREISKSNQNKIILSRIFSEVLSVKVVLFLVLILLLGVLTIFIPAFGEIKKIFFLASTILIGDVFSLRWFFLGLEKMKFKALINLIITVIYVVAILLVVHDETDYIWIPLLEGGAMILVSGLAFIWVIKVYKIELKFISFSDIKSYLKMNFNSFLNLVLPSTYGTIIVFLVGVFCIPIYVSYMQIGVKVSSVFSTLNTILTKVFYPIVNRNKTIIAWSRIILLSLGVLLSITMFFTSEFLLSLWLKIESLEELKNTILVVKLLSPIPFLMAVISSYGMNGLLVLNQDKVYSRINLVAITLMIMTSFLMIPKYLVFGGVLAFLSGRMSLALLSCLFYKKNRENV